MNLINIFLLIKASYCKHKGCLEFSAKLERFRTTGYRGWETGNVKTVALNDEHICTYYAGTGTTTGVIGVIVKN